VLAGHSEDVTCVVLTGRGRFAVTGGLDGTAQVWDMQAQDVVNHEVHDGKVRAWCCRGRQAEEERQEKTAKRKREVAKKAQNAKTAGTKREVGQAAETEAINSRPGWVGLMLCSYCVLLLL
jgi:hypothetical protein